MAVEKKKRGRKALSPKEKQESNNRQLQRIRIDNMIRRNTNIENICCICGKKGNVLHNWSDPYIITLICLECRKNPNNVKKALEKSFDIRTKIKDGKLTRISTISNEEVNKMINEYKKSNQTLSIGDYCKEIGISRYKFNVVLDRYQQLHPNIDIKELIKNKSRRIQKHKLEKIKEKLK